MGGTQSCINHENISVPNVTYNEVTKDDNVTSIFSVPVHAKCQSGKIITIRRTKDFKKLEIEYKYKDEKGNDVTNVNAYQMKEGFGNTSGDSCANFNVIISLVIIALIVLYINRNGI